jgi:hypothetical protein
MDDAIPHTLNGLTVQYVQASTTVIPGVFYLADVSAGDLVLSLPPTRSVPRGSVLGIKRVGADNTVTVAPAPGERLNGRPDGITTDQAGWGRMYYPHAPDGPAAGRGWMSY